MSNRKFYTLGIIGSVLLISIIIYCIVAAGKKDKIAMKESFNSDTSIESSSKKLEDGSEKNNVVTENFNEIKEENTNINNASSNINTEKKNTEVTNNKTKGTTQTKTTNAKVENKTEGKKEEKQEVQDPVFKYPVNGDFLVDYAKDKLVFSNTLGEWITHLGVDIKAEKTTIVKAAAEGTIKAIKNDPRYGLTVVVEHVNGYSTVYANLLTAEFVKTGEKVTQGQTLGTVGNTASFEILDESHLHFEILKDGEQIDPNMYLKK